MESERVRYLHMGLPCLVCSETAGAGSTIILLITESSSGK